MWQWVKFNWAAVTIWALMALWAIPGTYWFIQPVSFQYSDGRFYFGRETPFGDVRARWVSEVRSTLGECSTGDWADYEDRGDEPFPFQPPEEHIPCIPGPGEEFSVHTTRNVYVLGIFPLRPHRVIWDCVVDNGLCVRR